MVEAIYSDKRLVFYSEIDKIQMDFKAKSQ